MAERALELDETLADAHAMVAAVALYYDRDFEGAERGFARALTLNPYSPTVHLCYAEYLRALGRFDESLAELRRVLDLDPLSAFIYSSIGNVYDLACQYDQAVAAYRKTLEIDPHLLPAHTWLGLAYAQKGMWDEAITAVRRALAGSGGHPIQLASLGSVYALSGDMDEARSIWEQLQAPAAQAEASPFRLALLAASLGEKDNAFAWLEQAYRDRTALLLSLGHEPQLDCLRPDARFIELLRRVGLAQ
jgi:tetratricopeptide (TPR) repeat protein